MRAVAAAVLMLAITTCSGHAQGTPVTPKPPTPQTEPVTRPGLSLAEASWSTALLTEADVPPGLRLQPEASGPVNVPGLSGYLVTFIHAAGDETPDFVDLLGRPPGTVLLVKNSVQVLTAEAMSPGVLDAVIRGAEAAASAAGATIESTTDYAALPLGEDSRAHTMLYHLPDLPPVASTVVAFQRGDLIVALNLEAAGDDPLFPEALRLAQIVDERLADLLGVTP
jgi:hypothetical protein